MEGRAVVVFFVHVANKVGNRLGSRFGVKFQNDVAHVGRQSHTRTNRIIGLRHLAEQQAD